MIREPASRARGMMRAGAIVSNGDRRIIKSREGIQSIPMNDDIINIARPGYNHAVSEPSE